MESEEAAILLVEDDALVRETVNEVLIADGLRVTMAATGPAGLDRIPVSIGSKIPNSISSSRILRCPEALTACE